MITLPSPKDRRLLFNTQVTQDSIGALSKQILEIVDDDVYIKSVYSIHNLVYTPEPIKIYIDSYGGAVYQGFGLLGIIENSNTPIHTLVTGCAMSCGFLISIAGHKRMAYKSATFMYHQISSLKYGKLKEIEEDMIEGKRLQEMIEKFTVSHTKISIDRLKEVYDTKQDWYLNAEEALKHGIIDEII